MSAYLSERVAYSQEACPMGLASKKNRHRTELILRVSIDVLQDISDAVDDVQGDMDELNEYVEAIDEDLSDLEEELFDGEEPEDDDFLEIECPHCHETVYFDEDMLGREELVCPECHQVLFEEKEEPTE